MQPVGLSVSLGHLDQIAHEVCTADEILSGAYVHSKAFPAEQDVMRIVLGDVHHVNVCSAHSSLQSE